MAAEQEPPKKGKGKGKSFIQDLAGSINKQSTEDVPSALQGQIGSTQTTSKSQVAKASQGLDANVGSTLAATTSEEIELQKSVAAKKAPPPKAPAKVPDKAPIPNKPVKETVHEEYTNEQMRQMQLKKEKEKARQQELIRAQAREEMLTTPDENNPMEMSIFGKGTTDEDKARLKNYKILVEKKQAAYDKAYPEADFIPHFKNAFNYGAFTPMSGVEIGKGLGEIGKGVFNWTMGKLADNFLHPFNEAVSGDKTAAMGPARKEYELIANKLKREENKYKKPAIDLQQKYATEARAKVNKTQEDAITAAKNGQHDVAEKLFGQISNYRDAADLAEDGLRDLQKGYEGKDNIYTDPVLGLASRWEDLISVGLKPIFRDIKVARIANKNEADMDESERALLHSYANKQGIDNSSALHGTWYGAGKGAADSFTMMAGMILSEGAGGVVKKGVEGIVKKGIKGIVKSGLKKELQAAGKSVTGAAAEEFLEMEAKNKMKGMAVNLARKIPSKDKALGYAVDKIGQSLNLAYTVPFQPMTYQTALKNYIGQTEIIKDKQGKEHVLVRDGLFKHYNKEFESDMGILNKAYKEIENKPNKTEQDRAEMTRISDLMDERTEQIEKLRPRSAVFSAVYGGLETWAETWTEKVLGDMTQDAFGVLAKSKIGTDVADSALGKAYKTMDYAIEAGKAKFGKSWVGKLSKTIAPHGMGGVYHGLPAEVWEEIVREAIPSIDDSYGEKLAHLADPSFYSDVVAQTLIVSGLTSGGAGIVGVPGAIKNAKANAEYIDARRSIRALYRKMDRAVTDDQLAKLASMASAGTHYAARDYDIEITNLRLKGTEEAKKTADAMEAAKFSNLIKQAVSTGTLGEFKNILDTMVRQQGKGQRSYTEPTMDNLLKAQERVAELEKAQDQYKDKSNVSKILSLANDKVTARNNIQNLQGKLEEGKAATKLELEQFAQDRGHKVDIDADNLFDRKFADEKDQRAYDKFLNDAMDNEDILPETSKHATTWWAQENEKESLKQIRNDFNYNVSKKYETDTKEIANIRAQFDDAIRQAEAGGVDTPHLPLKTVLEMPTDRRGKLKEDGEITERFEAQVTPEYIDQFFKRLKPTGLSKDRLEALKIGYMIQAHQAEILRRNKTSENIKSMMEATKNQQQQNPQSIQPAFDEELQEDIIDDLQEQIDELDYDENPAEVDFLKEKLAKEQKKLDDYLATKNQEQAPNPIIVHDTDEMEQQKTEIRNALGRTFVEFDEGHVEDLWEMYKRNKELTPAMVQKTLPELGKAFSTEVANKISAGFKNISETKSARLVPETLREKFEENNNAINAIVEEAFIATGQTPTAVETPEVETQREQPDPDSLGPERTVTPTPVGVQGVTPVNNFPPNFDFATGLMPDNLDPERVKKPLTEEQVKTNKEAILERKQKELEAHPIIVGETPEQEVIRKQQLADIEAKYDAELEALEKQSEKGVVGIPETVDRVEPVTEQQQVRGNIHLQPLVIVNYDDTHKKMIKDLVADAVATYENEFGKKPSYKEYMAYTIKISGFKRAEMMYDSIGLGWQLNNYEEYDRDGVYKQLFATTQSKMEALDAYLTSLNPELREGAPATESEVVALTNQQIIDEGKKQEVITGFTEENIPVTAADTGTTVESVAFTFGYSAIPYKRVKDENGRWKPEAIPTRVLRQDSVLRFQDILKFDGFLPDQVVAVGVSKEDDWVDIKIVTGVDDNGNDIEITFAKYLENQPPGFRETQEFRDMVPMFFLNNKGEPVAFIHDTAWYNTRNVADPIDGEKKEEGEAPTKAHSDLLKKAKQEVSDFRNAILDGTVTEVKITAKEHGAFHSIEKKEEAGVERMPFIPISEANPQAIIAVQGDGDRVLVGTKDGKDVEFDDDTRKITNMDVMVNLRKSKNKNAKEAAGTVWDLRKMGIDPKDGKEMWILTKPQEWVTPEQLETARWAYSAFITFQDNIGANGKPADPEKGIEAEPGAREYISPKYRMDLAKAKIIRDKIEELTNLDISSDKQARIFFDLFIKPRNEGNFVVNGVYNYAERFYKPVGPEAFYTKTEKDYLGKDLIMPHIDTNGNVVNTGLKYSDYVKSTLTTGIISFNVGTEEKPEYITSVQPTIRFTYKTGAEAAPAPITADIKKVEQAAQEVIQEMNQIEDPQKLIDETKKLLKELGFNATTLQGMNFQPGTLKGTEELKTIYQLVPGLNVAQEEDLIKTVSEAARAFIESKSDKGVPTLNEVRAEIIKSQAEIMAPTTRAIDTAYTRVSQEYQQNPTPELKEVLNMVQGAVKILGNISAYWSDASLQAHLGEKYNGEVSVVDKALVEVRKTSELKEKKGEIATDEVPETEEQAEMETDLSERLFSYEDNASLAESSKLKAGYRLRRMMSGITVKVKQIVEKDGEKKEEFVPVTGFLKFNKLMSFNEIYDSVYGLLSTSGIYIEANYDIMKAKLQEMQPNNPWVEELIERFDKGDEMMRNQFVTNYRKHAVSMKFVMKDSKTDNAGEPSHSLQILDANANEMVKAIINTWKSNQRTSPLLKASEGDYYVNKEVAQELLNEFNRWNVNNNPGRDSEVEDVRKWLAAFGIDLAPGYMQEIKDNGFSSNGERRDYEKEFFTGAYCPVKHLVDWLKTVTKETGEINLTENPLRNPFTNLSNVNKALAKGEARYTSKVFNKSFRVAGKNVSGTTNPSFATNRVDDLKRSALGDQKFIKLLQSLSFNSESTILGLLTHTELGKNFASKFGLSHLSLEALAEKMAKTRTNASITELNSLDHDITKFGMFQDMKQGELGKFEMFDMRMGSMLGFTMSDKTQAYMFSTGVFNFFAQATNAFIYNAETKKVDGFEDRLKNLLYKKLVLPEMKRIAKFHSNYTSTVETAEGKRKETTGTDISGYNEAAQIFNMIPALNNIKDEKDERMISYFKEGYSVEEVEEVFRKEIDKTIQEVIMSLAEKKAESLEKIVVRETSVDKGLGNIKAINHFDTDYLATGQGTMDAKFQYAIYDFVINSMLHNADMFAMLAGDPALYSQSKHFPEGSDPANMLGDEFYIEFAQKQGVNIGKRLALLATPGTTMAEAYNESYIQLNLKDSKDISANSKYLIRLFHGEEALSRKILGEDKGTVAELIAGYPNMDSSAKKDLRKALAKAFPDIADYFDIESTDAQEYTTLSEHIRVMRGYGKIPEVQLKNIQNKIKQQKELEANAIGDNYKIPESMLLTREELAMVLQPQKPVYTGQNIDTAQDVARTIYIKSSTYPLIPQLTMGTELDNLRKTMEKLEAKHPGKGVRASYMTANKVGGSVAPIDPLNPTELEDEAALSAATLELDRNNYRNQQDIPVKDKSAIALGTQMFKILFGDGVIDLPGFRVDWMDKDLNGRELYEEFAKTFGDIIDLKKAQLYDELGLDPNGVPYDTRAHMHKLQELLKKEAIGRDYPIQDVKSLDLVELTDAQNKNKYYEFTMPLWLSANSNRFESMLNSIITKRVLAHKFPGNSFVAGSEHGYKFKEDLAGIDTSRIIYFDNYNGEELGAVSTEDVDGKPVFTKAQVLVPSKFKKSDGTLINLFEKVDGQYKYLIEEKGKPLKLKPNMIDPKLFSMFSFRTPTSSHVSGSIIEIAGILPPESGDLMIVPKNFTKQKGLDFDVDKENTYQLNHHVTKEGRIEEFTDYHVEKVRKQIDKLVNSKEYQDALALEKVERTVPEKMLKDFYDGLEDMFTEEELEEVKASRESLAEKTQSLKRKLKEKELKVLENKFIKIHQAVFSNPSDEMQKKVNKVLSMDFAREQAELIESMTDSSQGTPWDFTILSDQYQKEKMGLGAAGKMAIGVYSNYVTFHGLVQQLDTPSYLQRKNPEDPQGPSEKFEITIGKIYSNGMLGGQRTLTEHRDVPGDRSIAEVYAEKQNTATDNEKEQILGRVNINSLTIGVDSLLAGLGFDKVKYDTGEKDEYGKPIFKDISISYALLSQPVIREFVEHMQSGMGIISDFTSNLEETTIENLRKKYSETGKEEITSELLTGEALIAGLQTNGTQKDVQLAALNLFLELRAAAKKMSKVQSLINTKDLGKSATEAFGKYDNLENLAKTDVMSNATKLVGIYIPVAEGKPGKDYIQTKNYYILPTTPQGKMIATGITLGYDLWSDFFPYEDPHFKNIVDTIIKESTVDIDKTEKLIEAKHEIYREIKKYIYSSNYFGIFTENPEVERQRLFFDVVKGENQQQSLASYMSENQRHENLAQNKLLARFTYDLQTNGMPSTVRYNNTTSDDLEEKYLYTAFAEMILDEKELPPLNGKPMTTKMLAQELISYAYLEGGVQEAIQFIKYVPLEYLKEVGRYEEAEGRFVTALEKFQRLNPNRSGKVFETMLGEHSTSDKDRGIVTNPFITQFFQHNPDKVKKYQTKDKNLDLSKRDEGKATLVAEKLPAFFTINSKGKSKNKKDKVDLYKHIGGGAYVLIPTLGVHGMNEYQSENKNATSLVTKTKKTAPAIPVVTQVGPVVEAPTAADFMITNRPATDILNDISKSEIPAIAQYKALAGALLPIISQTGTQVKVVESTTPIMGGEVQGIYDTTNNNDTIYINSTASTNMVVTFMHEAMHSLTTKELEKYYDYDENGFATKFKTGITIPQHVVELHMVWQEAIRQSDPVKVQVVRDKVIRMRNGENVGLIEDKEAGIHEETLLYPLLDIFEFTQAALQSREFQQHYNQVPYKKSGKTIIDKIMDSFYKLLEALSIEKDTLSHASFVAAMRFVEEEHKGRRAVEDDATAGMPKLPSTIKFEDQLAHEKIFNAVGNALGGTAPLGSNLSTNLEEGKARGETMPPMSPRIESKEDYDTFVNEKETKLPCEGGLPI